MRSYGLRLTVQAPFMTRSSAAGTYGVDSPVARDGDGRPYIPGSHVQGKLREAMEELASVEVDRDAAADWIADWFGKPGTAGEEHRKRVIVSDLTLLPDATYPEPAAEVLAGAASSRTRIAIDDASGAALDRAFQTLETPFPARSRVTFEGRLRLLAVSGDVRKARNKLEHGLRWMKQIAAREASVSAGSST